MKNKFAEWLYSILNRYGIDPIYFATVICIFISLYYKNEFKNWNETSFSTKLLAISTVFGTSILVLLSLFRLVGIVKL